MGDQGPLFCFCRKLYHWFFRPFAADRSEFEEGAVYLCRHSGASGPIRSLVDVPISVRPWILSEFFSGADCRRFFATVTFRDRFHMPAFFARLLAFIAAPPFSRLVRSAGGIPVYRKSLKSRESFRLSADVLAQGGSLLIFPDVDYAEKREGIGALYRGFLLLEKLFYARTGRHVAFKPLHISASGRALRVGKTVRFTGDYAAQCEAVLAELSEEFARLEALHGN